MAVVRDLVIEQGESRRLELRWRTKVGGTPVDLTGCTFALQARQVLAASSPILLELSSDNGYIVITDALDGRFDILITDDYTYTLNLPAEPSPKRAVYDLICSHPNGEKTKLWKGNVVFYKAATYPPVP